MANTPYGIPLPPDSLLVRDTAKTLRDQATAVDTALGDFDADVTTAKNAAVDAATAAENAASLVNAPADSAIATAVGNSASQTRGKLETWIASKGFALASALTSLANRVTAVEDKTTDTGWVNIAVTAPYLAQPNYTPQVRKIGPVVYVRGGFNNSGMTTNSSYDVGMVPDGFRPLQTQYFAIGTSNPQNVGLGIMWADGRVQVRTNTSMSGYYLFDTTTYMNDNA